MNDLIEVGTVLAGYRIHRVIGRGGMGVVYLATDIRLDRAVALKVLAPDPSLGPRTRERFLHESRLAAAMDHPGIVPIFGAGEEDGRLWISMRYVDGMDLRSFLDLRGPMDAGLAARLLRQVALALDAAHARGIVHRDVKPSNILVERDPQAEPGRDGAAALGDHAYLTDFGLTRRVNDLSTLTSAEGFLGTIDYVAPEQIEGGAITGRTDQYGLAATLYTALTGRPPFERDLELATLNAHLSQPPPSVTEVRPDLPAAVDDVLAKGLAKDPADRYPTVTALIDGFEAALSETSDDATMPIERRPQRTQRTRLVVVATAVLVLAVAAALTVGRNLLRGGAGSGGHPSGVFEVELNGGALVELAPGLDRANELSVSRDGRWLAVAAAGSPTRAIYVGPIAGPGRASPLPAGIDVDHAPEWSPTGRLAIARAVGGTLHIFVTDRDGSNPTQLTVATQGNDRAPTWSPDGTMIAFVRGIRGDGHVIVMRADGTVPVDLTPEGGDDGTPVWSPSGRSLAIVRQSEGKRQIYVVSPDGSRARNLSESKYDDGAPAWSPDGKRIAFVRHYPGNADIMVADASGSRKSNLTKSPINEERPVWSPDGSLIAFVQRHSNRSHICVIAADGSGYRQLTAGPVADTDPSWIPGSSPRIAFVRSTVS